MIVATAVVVVNRPPDPAVVYEEVLKDTVERRPRRGRSVSARKYVRHSVPAVERPVVGGFAHDIERQIIAHCVAAAVPVVELRSICM